MSSDEFTIETDSETQDLKNSLFSLKKAFHKKFSKKTSSNNLRNRSNSRRHALKDITNGGGREINERVHMCLMAKGNERHSDEVDDAHSIGSKSTSEVSFSSNSELTSNLKP